MLNIGWSEVSITPSEKVFLCGQFYERISEYVETEITVTAMAVEADGDHMVICSCDLEGIGENLVSEVRKRLTDVDGLNVENVIIHATHSHTSIDYKSIRSIDLGTSLNVLAQLLSIADDKKNEEAPHHADVMDANKALVWIADKISQAVRSAWENRKPSFYTNQFGRAVVGMNRRVCYSDGSAKMWGDTNTVTFSELEGGNDSGMELLYVFDESKKLIGVVVNIACPSQVVEQRSFISSDYWGKVKILLREKFGEELYVLGLCAPAGDQCPRDLVRWVDPETPIKDPNVIREKTILRKADPSMFDIKGTWTIGKRISREIIDVYEDIQESDLKSEAMFQHEKLILDMPVRRVTPAEYVQAKEKIMEFAKQKSEISFADNAAMHVYAGTLARYEAQEAHQVYPVEIHIVRFGDVAFATNPFELFLNYGNQIRACSRAQQTFLIQLACGAIGYVPTEKAERGGHYSAYVSSGVTGHEGGELLVRKTLEEINKMFS